MDINRTLLVSTPPQTEKQSFIWKIDDFSQLLTSLRTNLSPNRLTTEFDAGATIGLISTWKMTFHLSNACLPVRGTKWFVRIQKTGGHPNATFYSCHVSLKAKQAPTIDLLRVELHRKQVVRQFGRLGQMIDNAVDDTLSIRVQFELWPCCDPAIADTLINNYYLLKSGEDSDAVIVIQDLDDDQEQIEIKVRGYLCQTLK